MATKRLSESMLGSLRILGGKHWICHHNKANFYRVSDGSVIRSMDALVARGLADKEPSYPGWKITKAGEEALFAEMAQQPS